MMLFQKCCCTTCDLVASASVSLGAAFTATFTGSATSSALIVSWAWSFGDGGTSSSQNPTHKYNSAGPHTATVTVTDADGCVDTASVVVTFSSSTCFGCTSNLPNSFIVTLSGNGTSVRGCGHCEGSVGGTYILTTFTGGFDLSCGRRYNEILGTGTATGCIQCTSHPGRVISFNVYGGVKNDFTNTILRVVVTYTISATGDETGCAAGQAFFEKDLGASPKSCNGTHTLNLVSSNGTDLCSYGFSSVTLSL